MNSTNDLLLDQDQSFMIVPVKGRFSDDGNVAITWRWPRVIHNTVDSVVSTTVLNAQKMHNLRVETIDGQCFLINDPVYSHENEIRICVENEHVGFEMVRTLIGLLKPEPEPDAKSMQNDESEDLGLPAKLRHLNKVAEYLMPFAVFVMCLSLSLAAISWILR